MVVLVPAVIRVNLAEAQLLLKKSGSNGVKNPDTAGGLSWALLLTDTTILKYIVDALQSSLCECGYRTVCFNMVIGELVEWLKTPSC